MGKRSAFDRIERDYYRTFDPKAVEALKPYIPAGTTFVEPCAGDGVLTDQLVSDMKLLCVGQYDIEPQRNDIAELDALTLEEKHVSDADIILTNPPWDRKILHAMIERFIDLRPTWLLFDSNWMFTRQAAPYLKYCTNVVVIGRLKWIPNTTMAGKDDCCWFRFEKNNVLQRTRFHNDR